MVRLRINCGSGRGGQGITNTSEYLFLYNIGDASHVLFELETYMGHKGIDVRTSKDLGAIVD